MKDRVLKLAKRSTNGVYIIQALLFKLKPVEVEFILDEIIPELSELISIAENQNLDLANKLIDASIIRGNYRRDEIIDQLFKNLLLIIMLNILKMIPLQNLLKIYYNYKAQH